MLAGLLLAVSLSSPLWAQTAAIEETSQSAAGSVEAEAAPMSASAVSASSAAEPLVPAPPSVEVAPEGGLLAQTAERFASGLASWYGPKFHGRRTANGERYDMHDFTAAHKTLPFGTRLRVRSVYTGKEVVVRINDRGPYKHRRIIDLSLAAMTALGLRERGVSAVELLRE